MCHSIPAARALQQAIPNNCTAKVFEPGQCLDRRLPDRPTLTTEVVAWERSRNEAECKIDWQFTTADARVKLKRLYPVIQPVNSALVDH